MNSNLNVDVKNALPIFEKIAKVSKMDCWFSLTEENKVKDLENNKVISLRSGVSQLIDGMTDYDYNHLTDDEKLTLTYALAKLI